VTNQTNYQIQTNELLVDFHAQMLEKLYLKNIRSCNFKYQIEKSRKPKENIVALHDKFIFYGSKIATSFVIIDVDYETMGLESYTNKVIALLDGVVPSWILRTDKGYHIGFILDKPVYFNNSQDKEKLQNIKEILTSLLNADPNGSIRTTGFWRNPLMYSAKLNTELFNLEQLNTITQKRYLKICKEIYQERKKETPPQRVTHTININKEGFELGNRNNFLFRKVVGLLYNGKITNAQVYDTLNTINAGELEENEIEKISKSIQKYNIQAKIKEKREYTRGEYSQTLWDNHIHNYSEDNKIVYSRQEIAQRVSTSKILANTCQKLLDGYILNYKNREKFTNANLVKNTKVSKSTIQRFRNKRKLEESIKAVAFRYYIQSFNNLLISVKADDTLPKIPLNIINKCLKNILYLYRGGEKVFKFGYEMFQGRGKVVIERV